MSPERALSFRKQELRELMEIEENLQAPLREIMTRKNPPVVKSGVRLLPHALGPQKRIEMIQRAKKEMLILSLTGNLPELFAENGLWKGVLSDVELKILTHISTVDGAIARAVNEISTSQSLSEMRHVDNVPCSFLIVDNAEILIEPFTSPHAELVSLWTDLPCYILPFRDYFKKLWKESINAQHRINIIRWAKSIEESPDQTVT